MGNTQGATRRDRSDSGGKRFSEDEYPVQLKIPRSLGNNNSTPSMQYEDTCEYPIVIKVRMSGGGLRLPLLRFDC